jgi:hypothetical protein
MQVQNKMKNIRINLLLAYQQQLLLCQS